MSIEYILFTEDHSEEFRRSFIEKGKYDILTLEFHLFIWPRIYGSSIVALAFDSKKLIGASKCRRVNSNTYDANVTEVLPEYRNKGIAKTLSRLRLSGAKSGSLFIADISPDNKASIINMRKRFEEFTNLTLQIKFDWCRDNIWTSEMILRLNMLRDNSPHETNDIINHILDVWIKSYGYDDDVLVRIRSRELSFEELYIPMITVKQLPEYIQALIPEKYQEYNDDWFIEEN